MRLPLSSTCTMSDTFRSPKCTPYGFIQKVSGFTGSRRLMCPLPPSANPSLAKMRNAPAICSSCQRWVASLVSGKGIRCSLLTCPVLPWDVLSMSRALISAATVGADARTVDVAVTVVMMLDGP